MCPLAVDEDGSGERARFARGCGASASPEPLRLVDFLARRASIRSRRAATSSGSPLMTTTSSSVNGSPVVGHLPSWATSRKAFCTEDMRARVCECAGLAGQRRVGSLAPARRARTSANTQPVVLRKTNFARPFISRRSAGRPSSPASPPGLLRGLLLDCERVGRQAESVTSFGRRMCSVAPRLLLLLLLLLLLPSPMFRSMRCLMTASLL